MRDPDSSYYLSTALRAMETAYASNHDTNVATHISQAMDALRRLTYQTGKQSRMYQQAASDPYEMDESNSAV